MCIRLIFNKINHVKIVKHSIIKKIIKYHYINSIITKLKHHVIDLHYSACITTILQTEDINQIRPLVPYLNDCRLDVFNIVINSKRIDIISLLGDAGLIYATDHLMTAVKTGDLNVVKTVDKYCNTTTILVMKDIIDYGIDEIILYYLESLKSQEGCDIIGFLSRKKNISYDLFKSIISHMEANMKDYFLYRLCVEERTKEILWWVQKCKIRKETLILLIADKRVNASLIIDLFGTRDYSLIEIEINNLIDACHNRPDLRRYFKNFRDKLE